MFSSLPMARLQTLPLTLGGIPCHHRSRTFLELHLDTKEARGCEPVVTEDASAVRPARTTEQVPCTPEHGEAPARGGGSPVSRRHGDQ